MGQAPWGPLGWHVFCGACPGQQDPEPLGRVHVSACVGCGRSAAMMPLGLQCPSTPTPTMAQELGPHPHLSLPPYKGCGLYPSSCSPSWCAWGAPTPGHQPGTSGPALESRTQVADGSTCVLAHRPAPTLGSGESGRNSRPHCNHRFILSAPQRQDWLLAACHHWAQLPGLRAQGRQ